MGWGETEKVKALWRGFRSVLHPCLIQGQEKPDSLETTLFPFSFLLIFFSIHISASLAFTFEPASSFP